MARTLPWTANAPAQPTKAQSKRSTSVLGKKEPNKEDIRRPKTPEPGPSRARKRVASRSPSTSPIQPPAQPAHEVEPMHPGPHADDKYIMVEDEFEAMARSFTAHLHAAEYARLKRKARQAPPKPLPDLSTDMSRSAKQSLERRRLLSRQSTTLSDFSRRPTATVGDEDEEEEKVEERVEDPWLGTSLAGLMDREGQSKRSLVALERVSSSTRAARGFGRGQTEGSSKRMSISDIFDQAGEDERGRGLRDQRGVKVQHRPEIQRGRERALAREVKIEDEPLSSKDLVSWNRVENETASIKLEPESSPRAKLLTSKGGLLRRSRIDELDDFEEGQLETTSLSRSTWLPGAKTSTGGSSTVGRKADGKRVGSGKDRKSRLDEVPVFLV